MLHTLYSTKVLAWTNQTNLGEKKIPQTTGDAVNQHNTQD